MRIILLLASMLLPTTALACDCIAPTEASSRQIMEKAYVIVRGTVTNIIPATQQYGVLDDSGRSLAFIEVAFAYDQLFDGTLYVDFNRSGSDCDFGYLPYGEERDFIIFLDDQNALYLDGTCTDLTDEIWKELHENAGLFLE